MINPPMFSYTQTHTYKNEEATKLFFLTVPRDSHIFRLTHIVFIFWVFYFFYFTSKNIYWRNKKKSFMKQKKNMCWLVF